MQIRDVDKGMFNLILQQNYKVMMDGLETRMRVLLTTPEEALAKKTYPCIYIDSGFSIETPEIWQPGRKIDYKTNSLDENLVDVEESKLICLMYSYRLGFMVLYKAHCVYLETELLQLFPNVFSLKIATADKEEDYVSFRRDGSFVSLDEFEENVKVYRRDLVLIGQIWLDKSSVDTLLRPFTGLDLSLNKL